MNLATAKPTRKIIKAVRLLALAAIAINLSSPGVGAITAEDLRAVNLGASVYYGGDIEAISNNSSGAGCYTLSGITINDADALADAIDEYISQKAPSNSPFHGLGDAFVSGSVRADINPFFLVAIARKESIFGTAGVATNGSNNAFGRTATSDQPHVETNRRWYKYDSFEASLDGEGDEDQPTYMRRVFIEGEELLTWEEVMPVYAPPSENDTDQYIAQAKQWNSDMIDLAGDSVSCSGSWEWPIEGGGTITSCFGHRAQPTPGASTNHPGVDISGGTGTPVLAAAGGEVVSAGSAGSAGNMIIINHNDDHSESLQTIYMHNDSMHVQVGERVEAGQHIADEGATGNVTGAHLHFEIVEDNEKVNPLQQMAIPEGVSITGSNCNDENTGGQM